MRRLLGAFLPLLLSGCALSQHSEELGTLLSQSREEALKERDLNLEDAHYQKVLSGIQKGQIKPGLSQDEIVKKIGKPVVVLNEGGAEEWLYKARNPSWFKADKIYLFFDPEGRLVRWAASNFVAQKSRST